METILFGYKCTPAYGWIGESDGGFSIEIYEDGSLIHKTYLFDEEQQTFQEYQIQPITVETIKEILAENQSEIEELPPDIDNGSMDGSCNIFTFNGKEVSVYNIEYGETPEEISVYNPEYVRDCLEEITQQNRVGEIFDRVVHALKEEGINLSLYEFSIS